MRFLILKKIFDQMRDPARILVNELAARTVRDSVFGDLDALTNEQFRSLVRLFLMLLHLRDDAIPDPEDAEEMVAFIRFLQHVSGALLAPGRLPPNMTVACSVVELEGWMTTDNPQHFGGGYSVLRPKNPQDLYSKLCELNPRVTNEMQWSSLFRNLGYGLDDSVLVNPNTPTGKKKRMDVQRFIRGKDDQYRWTQSLVYGQFVLSNRHACIKLLGRVQGADLVISLKRGGSYLGDQLGLLAQCSGIRFPQHIRVPKPSSTVIGSYLQGMNKTKATQAKKHIHTCMLIKSLELHVEARLQKSSTDVIQVVITETLVGGGSTNLLLKGIAYLIAKFGTRLRVRVLLHRHTLHQLNPRLEDVELDIDFLKHREQMPPIVLDDADESHKINLTHFCEDAADDWATLEYLPIRDTIESMAIEGVSSSGIAWKSSPLTIAIASARYLLGEDVNFFMSDDAHHPIILFTGGSSSNKFITIDPGTINSKMLLQLVVAGYFDHYLPDCEFWYDQTSLPNDELTTTPLVYRPMSFTNWVKDWFVFFWECLNSG